MEHKRVSTLAQSLQYLRYVNDDGVMQSKCPLIVSCTEKEMISCGNEPMLQLKVELNYLPNKCK